MKVSITESSAFYELHFIVTFKDHLKLEEWLSQNEQLQELYLALEGTRRVYTQSLEDDIRFALSQWVERYLYVEHSNVRGIAKTIIQWKEPITNAITTWR